MVSQDFRRQLEGYGLTTANILYQRPDHPWLLQTYVWQDYDLCPIFPHLNKFLNFWLEKLEGPLHSVTVAHARLIKPAKFAQSTANLGCTEFLHTTANYGSLYRAALGSRLSIES
jgi:uncharacterized protein Usg